MCTNDCRHTESGVIDSRYTEEGIRRRRKCKTCGHRWSTLEIMIEDRQSHGSALRDLKYRLLREILEDNLLRLESKNGQ